MKQSFCLTNIPNISVSMVKLVFDQRIESVDNLSTILIK